MVLPSWYWLTKGVLEKRPLNGCSSVDTQTYKVTDAAKHPTYASATASEGNNSDMRKLIKI